MCCSWEYPFISLILNPAPLEITVRFLRYRYHWSHTIFILYDIEKQIELLESAAEEVLFLINMATRTIFVPGTDWMWKFCRNIFLKKIWLSRKNCDCLDLKIKLVCAKLTYLLNESEMKRNKGKKESYCVVILTCIRLNFRWLEADFAGELIMNPDCGVMIDYEEV